MAFPHFFQYDKMDCGPTCLRIIAQYYGKSISLELLRQKTQMNREGVSFLGISQAAGDLGFKTLAVKITYAQLITDAVLPCIVHWNSNHFVVVTPKANDSHIVISDPARGIQKFTKQEFIDNWTSTVENGERRGLALLLEPQPHFFEQDFRNSGNLNWAILGSYLKQYKGLLGKVILTLLMASLLQLILPFLTQSIVDTGINTRNLNFIILILAAQFVLIFGKLITDFIRSRILIFVSTRVNISLLSDFWVKLLKLPIQYFDTKATGDLWQRLNDQNRIESFLTNSSISFLYSIINIIVFSLVLLTYNVPVFLIFMAGALLYGLWIRFFLSTRKRIDLRRFALSSKENNATIQLLQGIKDIKTNNAEDLFRWKWESIQASIFKLNFRSLSLMQLQQMGGFFINESKNLVIIFLSAKAVLEGQMTLGSMLAIQYVLGQLASPIEQMIIVIQQLQDAKLSLERINEIHAQKQEESPEDNFVQMLPDDHTVKINGLTFTYPGAGNEPVLKNISLDIPRGKVTAIVGVSGSGKTTLLKLLLKFYGSYSGEIKIDNVNFSSISPSFWRGKCGTVLQDGYIFNDTIAHNIGVGEESPQITRLLHACRVANILSFVESLPNGFNTMIGAEGNDLSQGQKQRILIARAVYKDPDYIFLDEATNALDANNEKEIMHNLQEFFKGRTVIVVAHRLSTVRNADNIVVLHKGAIAENGKHDTLTAARGSYYELVKNQLELGN